MCLNMFIINLMWCGWCLDYAFSLGLFCPQNMFMTTDTHLCPSKVLNVHQPHFTTLQLIITKNIYSCCAYFHQDPK